MCWFQTEYFLKEAEAYLEGWENFYRIAILSIKKSKAIEMHFRKFFATLLDPSLGGERGNAMADIL